MRITTTAQQDNKFIEEFTSGDWLERAADFVASHFDPEDVFSDEQLKDWALREGVENVFSNIVLRIWAKGEGYEESE